MHISLGSGKVNVSEDREGAGVGALVPVPRVVDHKDACDQVSRHLHTHAEKRLMKEQNNSEEFWQISYIHPTNINDLNNKFNLDMLSILMQKVFIDWLHLLRMENWCYALT